MRKSYIFLLLLFFGVTITAQQMRGDGPRIREERIAGKLNLTSNQLVKFNELQYEHQKKVIDLRSELQKNRLEIRKMMNDNDIDEKKLLSLTETNNKIHNEIRTTSTQKWLAVYKILDEDQKRIWTSLYPKGDRFEGYKGKFRNNIKERVYGRGKINN